MQSSDIELTSDADYLICALYRKYQENRKSGMSKSKAKIFGGSENIHETLMSEWSIEDVTETCRELHRSEMLQCMFADDTVYIAVLSDKAIIYMEKRFANNIQAILDNMAKIKSAIFF